MVEISRKLMIRHFLITLSLKDREISVFSEIRFDVFYVIMKRVPVITNFKRSVNFLSFLSLFKRSIKY